MARDAVVAVLYVAAIVATAAAAWGVGVAVFDVCGGRAALEAGAR